jgi:hypothetical protein
MIFEVMSSTIITSCNITQSTVTILAERPLAHIPAKKRFVFLITADRIQPIENFR